MNILMMTNTYLPHVGGVARSVASFAEAFRRRGHRVLVVAPTFKGMPAADQEQGVLRVPAIQRFNGSDFSVRLPVPGLLRSAVDRFKPDVIHSHHPFLLGDTALRTATWRNLPLVFTHHTMYEQYTHYVPGHSSAMQQFVIRLATEYANLCDRVVAPSQSIQTVLVERGVEPPVSAIPTGIDAARFACGDGRAARRRWRIPAEAFVVGHVGRLAPEKNLALLGRVAAKFVRAESQAHFLVVGSGPSREQVQAAFQSQGVAHRLHFTGSLDGQDLIDAYHAMDVFAFASQSETQGMVLAEAMAAGLPVAAVDAPGVREIVMDGRNGRLLADAEESVFIEALHTLASLDSVDRTMLSRAARATAETFSIDCCADRLLDLYRSLDAPGSPARHVEDNAWTQTLRLIELEWNLWNSRTEAALKSLRREPLREVME